MILWYHDMNHDLYTYRLHTYVFINFHQFSSLSHDMILTDTAARQHGSTAASAPARAIAPNLCSSSRVPRLGACGSELPARIQPVEPTMPTDLRTQRSQRRNFKNVTSLIHSDILHYFAYFWMIRNDMFNGKTFRVMSTLFTPPL